jgi:hypothetical protein
MTETVVNTEVKRGKGRPSKNVVFPTFETFTIQDILAANPGVSKGCIHAKTLEAVNAGILKIKELRPSKGRPSNVYQKI